MKIELQKLTNENMKQCFDLKVAKDQMQYILFIIFLCNFLTIKKEVSNGLSKSEKI